MWRRPLERTGTAALYLGLVLSHLVGEGGAVAVLCRPGQRATLPCAYHYEDRARVSQLSVQWRSPRNKLLCHYIKHRSFQNCTAGYAISYSPGSIALTIRQVRAEDFGAHVCSVSKRHEFSDYSVELRRVSESVTPAPTSRGSPSALSWILLLYSWALFVLHVGN